MDILNFFSGNGLFLLLGLVLVVAYFINKRKRK